MNKALQPIRTIGAAELSVWQAVTLRDIRSDMHPGTRDRDSRSIDYRPAYLGCGYKPKIEMGRSSYDLDIIDSHPTETFGLYFDLINSSP